jgi:hypothetical protein
LTGSYQPVDPANLPDLLADRLAHAPTAGRALRVAVDGPHCARPLDLSDSLVAPLRARGREATTISAQSFWRDASLRLEYGREDLESFVDWLDDAALRREVLDPLGPDGSGAYLPSLRDPHTNRATREPARQAGDGAIVIVGGELLLGRDLPFDLTIHLAVSSSARARRTDAGWQWTLPAFDRYDADVSPAAVADVVIRMNDDRHPAARGLATGSG